MAIRSQRSAGGGGRGRGSVPPRFVGTMKRLFLSLRSHQQQLYPAATMPTVHKLTILIIENIA